MPRAKTEPQLPKFDSTDEERRFWADHDSKRDVPYQSLIKIFLAERLEKEFTSS